MNMGQAHIEPFDFDFSLLLNIAAWPVHKPKTKMLALYIHHTVFRVYTCGNIGGHIRS